jgi:hypothetical protein
MLPVAWGVEVKTHTHTPTEREATGIDTSSASKSEERILKKIWTFQHEFVNKFDYS